MKSRSKELLGRAIAATVAAIEIYNKPNFLYREETFSILAVNGWELLLKEKWLQRNDNEVSSLYVMEKRQGLDKPQIRLSRSGNPQTHSLDYLVKQLVQQGELSRNVQANLDLLTELRDSAIHFYDKSGSLTTKIQEIGIASVQNFVSLVKEWFDQDLSEFNLCLMPLSFFTSSTQIKGITIDNQQRQFLNYLNQLEGSSDETDKKYFVTAKISVKIAGSKYKDAPSVRITSNPNAPEFRLTDRQMLEKHPWNYKTLMKKCKDRYSDFKMDKKFNKVKKKLFENQEFVYERYPDPNNPTGQPRRFYSPKILQELDKYYSKP